MLSRKFLVLTTLLLSSGAAFAGGWVSNGGNFQKDQDNTWFLGDEPVEYCIKSSSDFPLSKAALSALVKESIGNWIEFLGRYHLTDAALGRGSTLSGLFPDGKIRKISTRFNEVGACDATRKQIEFLFGISNDVIRNLLVFSKNELGLAVREEYDSSTFRNGGYIWIPESSPPIEWATKPNYLKHILLHEIGHVFGMKHDSTFVMNEKIGDQLLQRASLPSENPINIAYDAYFGKIESPNWPYKFVPGTAIDYTYNKGGFFDIPLGWDYNGSLPQEIQTRLALPRNGYHKLSLDFESPKALSLKLLTPSGATFRFTGHFDLGSVDGGYGNFGPGVYTAWVGGASGTYYWRINFDWYGSTFPTDGYFEYGGFKFGANISNSRGIRVKLFLPESGKWWTIQNQSDN